MPEDLADLDPDTQQFHVKMRAAYLMALGTTLVLIFSGMPCGSLTVVRHHASPESCTGGGNVNLCVSPFALAAHARRLSLSFVEHTLVIELGFNGVQHQ